MKKALLILLLCLAATGVHAADQCIKENLQLKLQVIELQRHVLLTQHIEITKELEDLKKAEVKAEAPVIEQEK